MNENQVMAQAVKTFHGEEGPKSPASAPFPVSRARFADLAANGLVIEASESEPVSPGVAADGGVLVADTTAEASAEQSLTEGKPVRSGRSKQ